MTPEQRSIWHTGTAFLLLLLLLACRMMYWQIVNEPAFQPASTGAEGHAGGRAPAPRAATFGRELDLHWQSECTTHCCERRPASSEMPAQGACRPVAHWVVPPTFGESNVVALPAPESGPTPGLIVSALDPAPHAPGVAHQPPGSMAASEPTVTPAIEPAAVQQGMW